MPEKPGPEPILIRLTPISVATMPAPAPEGFGIVGKLFILEALGEDLSPREDLLFDIPVQLVVFYTREDLDAVGADESELIMAQYRTARGSGGFCTLLRTPTSKGSSPVPSSSRPLR